jgi:transcriptional regulator of heat shock response
MSDKVLDLIKNRIKTNYDKLYSNYDENKKTILKQMQHVETNMATENTVNKGFENLIKEKSNYDKSKADLEGKQKKLKKVILNVFLS